MRTIRIYAGWLGGLTIFGSCSLIVISLSEPGEGGWAFVGVLIVFAGAYLLIAGFRAGIGVARDGVLVRSMSGRTRWISWPEIDHFGIIVRQGGEGYGESAVIAVVFVDNRKPLHVSACTLGSWEKVRTKTQMDALQDALENERENAESLRGGIRRTRGRMVCMCQDECDHLTRRWDGNIDRVREAQEMAKVANRTYPKRQGVSVRRFRGRYRA
jgi:hypothetical protein